MSMNESPMNSSSQQCNLGFSGQTQWASALRTALPEGREAEGIQFGSYVGGLERKEGLTRTQWMEEGEEEEEGRAPVSAVCPSVIPSMFVWGVLGQGYHLGVYNVLS